MRDEQVIHLNETKYWLNNWRNQQIYSSILQLPGMVLVMFRFDSRCRPGRWTRADSAWFGAFGGVGIGGRTLGTPHTSTTKSRISGI